MSSRRAQQMQMLQEQLALPQDKTLIHINRKLNVSNSNKNNVVNYRLVDPISVRKGDSIALYEAFLNIRGQNSQTINILEDITTELKYMYYVPNDVMANASLDGDFQHATNQIRTCEYKQIPDAKMDMLSGQADVPSPGGQASVQLYENMLDSDRCVPQGSPMIMAAVQPFGSNPAGEAGDKNRPTCVWRTSSSNITIKAGNYDVNALGEIITEQLNGNEVNNNPFENLLFQQNPSPIDLEKINSVANNQFVFNLQNESNTGQKYQSFADMVNNESEAKFTTDPDAPDDGFMCFFDLQTFNKQKARCEDFYLNGNPGNIYGSPGNFNFFEINEQDVIDPNNRPTPADGSAGPTDTNLIQLGKVDNVANRALQTSNIFPDFALCPRNITTDNPFQFFNRTQPNNQELNVPIYNPQNSVVDSTEPAKNGLFGGSYVCSAGVEQFCGNPWESVGGGPPENGNPVFLNTPSNDESGALNAVARSNNGRFIGTKSFALTFNGGKANRFALSNLHEPYRIPSVSQSLQNPTVATPMSGNVGEPGTKMLFGGKTNVADDVFNGKRKQSDGLDLRQFAYNVEASSGVTVLGFAWDKVRETARWQDLNEKMLAALSTDIQLARCYNFLMNCMPWDWYFEGNERAAREAWDSTLWAQLGFNYEDIGNVSSRLENYYTQASWFQAIGNYDDSSKTIDDIRKYAMPGIITHNEASLSFATSLNCLGNVIDINTRATASADAPTLAGTFQTFDTMGSFLDVPGYPGFAPQAVTNTGYSGEGKMALNLGTFDFGTLPLRYAVVPVLTEPQYIVGSSYPNLAANSNYFIIESDVVQSNYLDPEGSKKTVIGFVSKQESVADTLFSTQGIDFVFKQDRIINDIGIRVTNVDGTDVDNSIINDGSGFIFILQRNSNAIDNYLAVAEQLALEEQGAAGPAEPPQPSE